MLRFFPRPRPALPCLLLAFGCLHAATTTVPAKPGDILILWGTGFGPTNPVPPSGTAVPGDKTYLASVIPTVTINNVSATVRCRPGFRFRRPLPGGHPGSADPDRWRLAHRG
jgi:hypothetical protein